MDGLMVHAGASKIGRQDLLVLPTPEGTPTHKPIPHHEVVQALVEALAYRKLEVVKDEYAVSKDGMKMFGFLALNIDGNGIRLGLGLRNSHDKTFSLGITVGYRVFVCDNLAFHGDFTPVAHKHTKHMDIIDVMNTAVDKAQRHFDPLKVKVDAWQNHSLPDVRAKEIIYDAFVGDQLEAPKHMASLVHANYFQPRYPEFEPRTMWSLSNAFTSAFKELEPVPQMKATARLAPFLASC